MTGEQIQQRLTTVPEPAGIYVECSFDGVDGERADLRGTAFEGCRLTSCSLRLADVTNARFSDCTFVSCDLMGVDFTRARWGQFGLGEPLRFIGCRLDYANMHALRLEGAVFYDCSLVEADLGEAVLAEADLRFADLTGTRFNAADLSRADLSGAVGFRIHPDHTRLAGTRVSLPDAGAMLELLGMTVTGIDERLSAAQRLDQT